MFKLLSNHGKSFHFYESTFFHLYNENTLYETSYKYLKYSKNLENFKVKYSKI